MHDVAPPMDTLSMESGLHNQRADRDKRLRDALLSWYDQNRRNLPWRDANDPWAVWVSEIMLQQTRVETVRGYFERWMGRFPTVGALAAATIDDVLSLWQGLGYYSRARNLHRAARLVVEHHDGRIPDTLRELRALPGVGAYTAGAIASIAFGREAALVDGNVLRMMTRLDGIHLDIGRSAGQRAVWARCEDLVPGQRPGDFNQSLMELGATICVPRNPRCKACPVAGDCVALADDQIDELPVRAPKAKPRDEHRFALVVSDADGRHLVAKRPPRGLLADLWEFPFVEEESAVDEMLEALGCPTRRIGVLDDVVHVFSHIRLTVTPLLVTLDTTVASPQIDAYSTTQWVDDEQRATLPRARLMQKLEASVAAEPLRLAFG